jgi:hypothetical protein
MITFLAPCFNRLARNLALPHSRVSQGAVPLEYCLRERSEKDFEQNHNGLSHQVVRSTSSI